jgi:hypothetical protein
MHELVPRGACDLLEEQNVSKHLTRIPQRPALGHLSERAWYFEGIPSICRDFGKVLSDCEPPFEQTPSCYTSGTGIFIISSPACAQAWAKAYNITDVTPLETVALEVKKLDTACRGITQQVRFVLAPCELAHGYESFSLPSGGPRSRLLSSAALKLCGQSIVTCSSFSILWYHWTGSCNIY